MSISAVIVCVDYSDYLSVTLPYNRHHFDRVIIVTAPMDYDTTRLAVAHGAETIMTDSFYRDGKAFNKYLALEEGLTKLRKSAWGQWICIMDADVLWPKAIDWSELEAGKLYSPRRRMYEGGMNELPHEPYWRRYPLHRLHNDPRWRMHFSGYTQLFHASDPALKEPPWHRLDLPDARAGDTYFQDKWKEEDRVRPDWECLHLGPCRVNWQGRKSPVAT